MRRPVALRRCTNGLKTPLQDRAQGSDNDCNGTADDGLGSTFYADTDGDDYGDPAVSTLGCSAPSGYVSNSIDCDDSLDTVFPGEG